MPDLFVSGRLLLDGQLWLGLFGFATGGLLVFLGGLIAVDIAGKKAAGAAMGVIGVFSYIGAGCQTWISGLMIKSSEVLVDGVEKTIYDFNAVIIFWIGASVASMGLALLFFSLHFWKTRREQFDGNAG